MRRCLLILAACAGLGAESAEGQVFAYMAMGDSITDGSFDEQNKGGYRNRLESRLGCTGGASSCNIWNEGVGGNTTAQMLSRIDGALNARSYDVMLLMGGTNDIFRNIGNGSIEFNLTEMYNRATDRGVDTVFASIIWFHPSGTHGTSKNGTVQNLRTRVTNLANQRSGYMVDNWSVLCPQPAGNCFTVDYYSCVGNPANPPGCGATMVVDPVGHPDASGYEIMADQFESELTMEALPAVPSPTSPSGTVVGTPTTYTWNRDSGNRATWYELDIDGPGGGVHLQWHEARFDCAAGVCNVNPGVNNLNPGTYSWRVRGRTPRGRGSWSAFEQFTIATPPSTPNAIAPSGIQYVPGPSPFTFEWSSVANANNYRIQVFNPSKIIDQTYSAGAVCSGSTCDATPGTALGDGSYTWQVRAMNAAGSSGWSSLAFEVIDAPPAPSVPGYPDREIFETDPLYVWTGAAESTFYKIEVFLDGGAKQFEKTFDTSVCSGLACSATASMPLTPDDYTWRVTSGNPVGESTPSAQQPFTVLVCSPQTVELENQEVSTSQMVQACETVTAGNLGAGNYVIVAGGDVTLHGGDLVRLENGFRVLSGGELTVISDQ